MIRIYYALAALAVLLQGIFLLLLVTFGPPLIIDYWYPRARLARRFSRLLGRVFIHLTVTMPYWLLQEFAKPRPPLHAQQIFLDNYPLTPLDFYNFVELALARRLIPGLAMKRVRRREWSLLSASRLYLHLQYRTTVCFVGGAPFGTGFLISWRYGEVPAKLLLVLLAVPYLGPLSERLLRPPTYYRADIYLAFERAIRAAVLEVTQQLTQMRGLRPLHETEQRPLLREFYEG